MNLSQNPITVTRLTAPGRGAVAVLRIDTCDDVSAQILDSRFIAKNGMQPSQAPIGRILYGDWGPEDVVVVRVAPQSWEVNCHGGEVAAGRITADLLGNNSPPGTGAEHPDFDERVNAALLQRLLLCRTKQTARYLLAQQQKVLPTFLNELREATNWPDCRDSIKECLKWERFSQHLTDPWQVAIVGQPNAGKSSLLNAIVGFDRSIVFDQPGTTRDRVEADIVLDGWPFRLIDTAGIRDHASDDIETVGVEAARASLQQADACLLVVDAVCGWTPADQELLEQVPANCPSVVAFNKVDLVETTESKTDFNRVVTVVRTSVPNYTGITETTDWLPRQLVPDQPALDVPLPVVEEVDKVLSDCLAQESLEPLAELL